MCQQKFSLYGSLLPGTRREKQARITSGFNFSNNETHDRNGHFKHLMGLLGWSHNSLSIHI